jgi:hypothetical protein
MIFPTTQNRKGPVGRLRFVMDSQRRKVDSLNKRSRTNISIKQRASQES